MRRTHDNGEGGRALAADGGGVVKAGYKQTEIGVIPADWDAKPLPQVAWFQEGPGLRNWQFTKSGMKVINVTNLENGFLNLAKTDRHVSIDEFDATYKHFEIDVDDIVMASSGNSYSKVAIVREQDLPLMMNTSVIRFKPFELIVYQYLLAYLKSTYFKAQIDQLITGGAQPNFGPFHLRKILVPLPDIEEQKAIAAALSDVDELLAALAALIAKKRAVKQGAMQQLLTGRTRLPGFGAGVGMKETEIGEIPADWDVVPLDDAVDFLDGMRRPIKQADREKMSGQYPYYGASGIVDYVNDYIFDEPLILLGEDGENILSRNLRLAFKVDGKIWVNNHAHVLRPEENCNIDFLVEYLESIDYTPLNSGTAQPKLNKKTCSAIPIPLPSASEQKAIAAVLSDMDAEIAALEARHSKTVALKQGMMQALLTGRVRLI